MHMKYNAYEVFELFLFVFDMGYNKKNIPSFPQTMNRGVINMSQNATTLSIGTHQAQCS